MSKSRYIEVQMDRDAEVTGRGPYGRGGVSKSLTNQMAGFLYTLVYQICCPCEVKSFV
jgi:hypothetical protein